VLGINSGTVKNCYATGNISGTSQVGGVVGTHNIGNVLEFCHSTGDVSGTGNDIGGVAGGTGSGGRIRFCYATGNVSGNDYVGGITGNGQSEYCVALNLRVNSNSVIDFNVGRISGRSTGLLNNYAREDMDINKDVEPGPNTVDGESITVWDEDFWASIVGFTDTWWEGKLPIGGVD